MSLNQLKATDIKSFLDFYLEIVDDASLDIETYLTKDEQEDLSHLVHDASKERVDEKIRIRKKVFKAIFDDMVEAVDTYNESHI